MEYFRLLNQRETVTFHGLPPFILRPVTQAENRELYTVCRRENGTLNRERYVTELMCRAVVQPDLHSAELQAAYGVLGADRLLCQMLLAGEFARLWQAVRKICGMEERREPDGRFGGTASDTDGITVGG